MYVKKIVTTGFNAAIKQIGNRRLERNIELGTKLGGYVLLGVASGPSAAFTVPAAIATDITVNTIENTIATYETNLNNARIVEERGVRRKLGAGGYLD